MKWEWDNGKDLSNRRKHGLSFETAKLAFDDPFAATRRDTYPDEVRWQTLGLVGSVLVLVVHTYVETDGGEEGGRIISARRATSLERRIYEEGDF